MILRRVIDHFRKQEWTAIAIDFVIVVLGVFIGIQVSNWNGRLADRVSEQRYIGQLRQDLTLIERQVRDQIEFEQFQSRIAAGVADTIDKPGRDAEEKIIVGLTQLTMRRTLRVESPTFADLQSSGNLEIIADPALRAAIIACFFSTGRMEAAIDKNNLAFVDQGYNDFIRSTNLRNRVWDDALMGATLPVSVRRATSNTAKILSRPPFADDAIRVLDNPALERAIVSQLSWRILVSAGNEGIAQQMLDTVRELEKKLDAELKEHRQ